MIQITKNRKTGLIGAGLGAGAVIDLMGVGISIKKVLFSSGRVLGVENENINLDATETDNNSVNDQELLSQKLRSYCEQLNIVIFKEDRVRTLTRGLNSAVNRLIRTGVLQRNGSYATLLSRRLPDTRSDGYLRDDSRRFLLREQNDFGSMRETRILSKNYVDSCVEYRTLLYRLLGANQVINMSGISHTSTSFYREHDTLCSLEDSVMEIKRRIAQEKDYESKSNSSDTSSSEDLSDVSSISESTPDVPRQLYRQTRIDRRFHPDIVVANDTDLNPSHNRSSKEIIDEKDYIKPCLLDKDSTHFMIKQPLYNQIYNFLFGSKTI